MKTPPSLSVIVLVTMFPAARVNVPLLPALVLLTLAPSPARAHGGLFRRPAEVRYYSYYYAPAPVYWMPAVQTVTYPVFVRPVIVRKLGFNVTKVVDSLIGERAIVLSDLPVSAEGKAEMRGSTWTARNVGETPLTKGQRCVVEQVVGLTIHVRAS